MNPEDDPEARIRDLERSLSEQARTSELPSALWGGYTDQLPPPVYPNVPYPAAAPPRSGIRAWRLLGVLAFVVICAASVGAGVYLSSRGGGITGSPTTRPTVYGGGGSITETPLIPDISTAPTQAPPSVGTSPAAPPGGHVSISGVGEARTIDCNGGSVNISGMSNNVVITGHCANVTVSGMKNIVSLDSADTVNASGIENRVTYHSGSPEVDNSGISNVVEQG